MEDMKKTQTTLMMVYVGIILMTLLLVVLCETDVLDSGQMAHNKQAEFVTTAMMELITLASAFFGLRMFKFQVVRQQLLSQQASALLKFGLVRLVMLEAPMLSNTLFYYMFFMKAPFGYMAVILLLCLAFVVPTKERCKAETSEK